MILTETKLKIENRFKEKYPSKKLNSKTYFCNSKGEWFNLVQMGNKEPWNCFVLEYDNGEDGDLYYPNDYDNFEQMFTNMVKEIET